MKDILQWLYNEHQNVFEYLPEPELELPKTPKQWIVNVVATVLKEKFSKWVEEQIKKRHAKVAKD